MNTLLFKDLGRMDYQAACAIQESLLEVKQSASLPDILLLVEHPHVFTIGRSGKEANVLCPAEVPVCRASRGGDVTYHGPGQVVAYPLLDLRSKLRRDVHRYLRGVERTLIRTLDSFGVGGDRKPPWTGVWVGERKIASIGVAVRRGITCHGAALNVNTDLAYFRRIVPCGLAWARMTSIQRENGKEVSMNRVKERFLAHFMEEFRYLEHKELCREDIRIGSRSDFPAAPAISTSSGS